MKKTLTGKIVSDKMTNTAVVSVATWLTHPIIHKRYQRHRKFMVENPNNEYKNGQTVEISPTKPLSRHKHYTIVGVVGVKTTVERKPTKRGEK